MAEHIRAVSELISGVYSALPKSISGYFGWYLAFSFLIALIMFFKK